MHKAGYKTTEFWLTGAMLVFGTWMVNVGTTNCNGWWCGLVAGIGGLMAGANAITYSKGRSAVKQNRDK